MNNNEHNEHERHLSYFSGFIGWLWASDKTSLPSWKVSAALQAMAQRLLAVTQQKGQHNAASPEPQSLIAPVNLGTTPVESAVGVRIEISLWDRISNTKETGLHLATPTRLKPSSMVNMAGGVNRKVEFCLFVYTIQNMMID